MGSIFRRVLFIFAGAAIISACSSAQVPSGNQFGLPALRTPRGQALLYVSSDYSNEKVYSYPEGKLLQTLDIPGEPQALCTDKLGDVYIAESYGESVAEYAPGGTEPIASWEFPKVTPEACAVDRATGKVAVAGGNQKLVVFSPTTGNTTYYSNSAVENYFYATYDADQNLFVEVYTFGSGYELWELGKGSSKLKHVKLPFRLCCPLDVQWDGKYLAIEEKQSSLPATIDRLAVADYRAKVEGRVRLTYTQSSTSQFWIAGSTLIHSDYYSDDVAFFKYPAGGRPTKTIVRAGPDVVGIAVSEPPK